MSTTTRTRIRITLATFVLAAGTVAGTGVAEAKAAPGGRDAGAQAEVGRAEAGKAPAPGQISTRGFRNR